MANPSLQIGNSNWAIKEDDLLGYSTVGTNYLPKPMTMTRASLGTRVNSNGLVEDVELLGSELVTCGDFSCATPSTYWNPNIGWSIGDNKASNDGTDGILRQIGAVPLNTKFKVVFTVDDYVTGNIQIKFAPVPQTIVITGDGTYTIYTDGNNSVNGDLQIIAINSFQGSITNISVKEVTIENLARVDYTDGTSSLLVEPQRRNLVTYSESISNLSSNTNGTGTFTITDNYTDSPQGVQNASRVQMSIVDTDDTSNYRLINTGSVMTNGVTREISFYAKSLTGSNQDVLVYWSYDQQIVTLTNDWQRFKISATSGNTGSIFIGTRGGSGSYFSGGDGNLDFALWGLQVEDDGSGGGSSYATSYIPTSGSTVTRVQETYTKTGISNLIGQTEGTFFIELSKPVLNFSTQSLISLNNAASNSDANSIAIGFDAGDDFFIRLQSNNVLVFQETETNADANTFYKIAISYKSGESLVYVNGSPITPNSGSLAGAFTFTATLDNLSFDFNGNNGLPFYGKVKQLQVFKTALKDEQLKTLTT